jgi:8-oxo-dGTP diphosphatase
VQETALDGSAARDGRRPVVGAAVVRGSGSGVQLLAARRTEPPELAGGWELPGGKVEPGEAAADALRREILEELGVQVRLVEEVPGPDDGGWPLGRDYRLRVWIARVEDGVEPRALEQHDAIRWLGLDDWQDVAWLAGDLPPVAAVVARLRAAPA